MSGTILREQVSLVLEGLKTRRSMIGSGLLALITVLMVGFDGFPAFFISNSGGPDARAGLDFFRPSTLEAPQGAFGLLMAFGCALLVGFFWPMRVWRDATPAKRGYFWSLPVDRSRHELLRVAGGALVLELVLLVLVLLAAGTALVTGSREALAEVPLVAWLGFLVGPLIVYLLNSIAALRTNLPAVWLVGFYYSMLVLLLAARAYQGSFLGQAARQLMDGPYSLMAAVVGPLLTEVTRPHYEVSTGAWPAAAALWLAIGVVAVLVAARIQKR